MQVLVVGATGKTGRHVCLQALEKGHAVTALARNPGKAASIDKRLAVHAGDALNPADVRAACEGMDAAVFCLGHTNLSDKKTLPQGAANLIEAMSGRPNARLVALSAIGVGDSWRQLGGFPKLLFKTMLRNILDAHHQEEENIRASALNWTIVRAAVLNDSPASGQYEINGEKKAKQISRADLAAFLVSELEDPKYARQTVSVFQS